MSWPRCNTVGFTDCQYGTAHREDHSTSRRSIPAMVADPQCAAGVNFLVKRIAPPRFNCSTSRGCYAMARSKFIMTRFSAGPVYVHVSVVTRSSVKQQRHEFSDLIAAYHRSGFDLDDHISINLCNLLLHEAWSSHVCIRLR